MKTVLKGTQKTVTIERGQPTVIIGERINPTGRKKLAEALLKGDMDYVRNEAIQQVEDGADIIDVNVGVAGGDDDKLLPLAVKTVAEAVDVPIAIDSPHPTALPAALKICPGRPADQLRQRRGSLAQPRPAAGQGIRLRRHRPDDGRQRHPAHRRCPPGCRPQDRRPRRCRWAFPAEDIDHRLPGAHGRSRPHRRHGHPGSDPQDRRLRSASTSASGPATSRSACPTGKPSTICSSPWPSRRA